MHWYICGSWRSKSLLISSISASCKEFRGSAEPTKIGPIVNKVIIEKFAVGDFYGTGIEICAWFGPVGITRKKRFGPIMSNFLGRFFQVFVGKKTKSKIL